MADSKPHRWSSASHMPVLATGVSSYVTAHQGSKLRSAPQQCCEADALRCRTSPTGLSAATVIGKYVTIGQGCLLRSATVEDKVVIGDRSILMEGSLVESNSVLAPGTVLPPGRLIPSGQLWAGNPARYVRDLSKDEVSLGTLP